MISLHYISGTFYTIPKFIEDCGHRQAQADLLVNDMTLRQCFFFDDTINRVFYINYETQCARIFILPRYGLAQKRVNECHFQLTGRKELSESTWIPYVMECGYSSQFSGIYPGSQERRWGKAGNIVMTRYKFHPACSYAGSPIDVPATIYPYEAHSVDGKVGNDELHAVRQGFLLVGPHEGYYSLRGLVHEVPSFESTHHMYSLTHFNLPQTLLANSRSFIGK